ncbi:putative D123-domain-containing protein [Monocercomonoides exilis]|uniref:putative D123-domain-containing protein n=1 Tax=Monocercomonoides exilis TaxID=2049356 RepID=UPI00355A83A7|nr:putative D123-domain-containing protein [Monocercomonoides exilis]|eukprot:MONOS_6783.1-p1 / transcript=MONOS_6783.1 / gene=MONOS_6783 / organism=Monocercomonoides_exilis_PA203 / gene_product=D123-domain-containing protein / transcript_product=D123-domain-containing protein / location=Mono_scaffold00220:50942-52048(-) / protein_length=368 / sequence_SO=supercontig / SO=protein_coding / is_pseudo=false
MPEIGADDFEDDHDFLDHNDPEWKAFEPDPSDPPKPKRKNTFPEICTAIQEAFNTFGTAIPKLNWTTPKDAIWANPLHTLRCEQTAQVLLLLKASDETDYNLHHMFDNCEPPSDIKSPAEPVISLREFFILDESHEFRCFIINGKFVGISQRHADFYYSHLQPVETQNTIISVCATFWQEQVKNKFPIKTYTMDVYLTKTWKKVKIVDFGVLSEPYSDPLLFSFQDLFDLSKQYSASEESSLPSVKENALSEPLASPLSSSSSSSSSTSSSSSSISSFSEQATECSGDSPTQKDESEREVKPILRIVQSTEANMVPLSDSIQRKGRFKLPDEIQKVMNEEGLNEFIERVKKENEAVKAEEQKKQCCKS